MTKELRFPNDQISCEYSVETDVIKYTPYESLSLFDFIKLYFEYRHQCKAVKRFSK